ncbi:MAG: DUF1992 domain-containing protein [Deltaproteobacteria bacterium]|nr:DUF1992 domain-containing protein [Deltaproteobacteria bacterium]
MDIFSSLAEKRIEEAIRRGELDNLPGAGKPLKLDDDSAIPEDLRMSYRLLKNAGFIPPELEDLKELVKLKDLIASTCGEEERSKRAKELNFKLLKVNMSRKRPLDLDAIPEYKEKMLAGLTAKDKAKS